MFLDNLNPFGQFKPMMMFAEGDVGAGDDGNDDGGSEGGSEGDSSGNEGVGSFYDGFSDDIRNHPSVTKFKNAEDLATSYVNLEKKIGEKGVIIPKEGAPQEEIDAYYKAIGRPEAPDGYKFDTPEGINKNIQITPELEGAYKDVAFKLGLTAEQAAGLRMYHLDSLSQQISTSEKAREDALLKAQTELRNEFGGKYDGMISTAVKVVDKFGGQEVKDLMNDSGLGNHPAVIKMMSKIGSKLSEDSIANTGSSDLLMSPAQAKAEIAKINSQAQSDPKHPLMDDQHPEHKEAIAKRDSLYKIAYPENK